MPVAGQNVAGLDEQWFGEATNLPSEVKNWSNQVTPLQGTPRAANFNSICL
jgi:hypothetical protein